MKKITLFVLFTLTCSFSNHAFAQSYTTDSTGVYYFWADVEDQLQPNKKKDMFNSYFEVEQFDLIYTQFMQVLSDSAGFKLYPIEHIPPKSNFPRREYPRMMKKKAVKSKKAAYYMKVDIEFKRGGESSMTDKTTISNGLFGGGKDVEVMPLVMKTNFELYDATGKKVKSFKTSVKSRGDIGLVTEKALIGKSTGRSQAFYAKTLDNLVDLIQQSAMSVVKKLQ